MKRITLLGWLMIATLGCTTVTPPPTEPASETEAPLTQPVPPAETGTPTFTLTELVLPAAYAGQSSWIDIYFTNPESPLAAQETGGLDGVLVEAIDAARLTVDVAIYSFSLRNIRDALIRADERGVQVRVVMESDRMDQSVPQALKDAGIPVLGDRREGLMHDKFVIIDRSEVLTGSMNFTYSGTYDDNNQLIHIRSVKMAENYTKEFNEMFEDDMFGSNVVSQTPNPEFSIDGVDLAVYFSPDDGVAEQVMRILNAAEESIYFMAYSFTRDDLGEAIRAGAERGLTVAGVMEGGQVASNIGTEYDLFKFNALDVLLDGSKGQMHHKTMIVDRKIVITGSYNFSRSAEIRNDENLIVIFSVEIADFFLDEFQRVYDKALEVID